MFGVSRRLCMPLAKWQHQQHTSREYAKPVAVSNFLGVSAPRAKKRRQSGGPQRQKGTRIVCAVIKCREYGSHGMGISTHFRDQRYNTIHQLWYKISDVRKLELVSRTPQRALRCTYISYTSWQVFWSSESRGRPCVHVPHVLGTPCLR